MAGRTVDPPTFRYRDLFPWVYLFRAFRLARDGRKLLLAAAALLLIAAGNAVFWWLPFAPDRAGTPGWPWSTHANEPVEVDGVPGDVIGDDPGVGTTLSELLRPLEHIVAPAWMLMDGRGTFGETLVAWMQLLWALAVWSFFGAAITRLAAVEFARDEKISLTAAVRFAGGRFVSYFCAPLLPVAFILVMWALCLAGGLIGRIPWIGETLAGLLWFIPLILGFFMALLVIGIAAGWPLMVGTISTEATDAYDGFSRSYSYVYSRPWHAVWYALVALAYGFVVLVFVKLVASLLVYLAGWAVASGMGLENLGRPLPPLVSEPVDTDRVVAPTTPDRLTRDSSGWTEVGRPLAGFWLHLVVVLVVAFASSYFWTAATIIYFLLRRSEDATDLDEVYLTTEPERDDLLPLVGVAASDQPVIERPPHPPEAQGPAEREPGPDEPSAGPSSSGGT